MKTPNIIKRILAASDLSKHADYAIYRAAQLAAQHAAKLFLLHVVDEELSDQSLLELIKKGPDAVADKLVKDAEASLQEQADTLAGKHFFNFSVHVKEGKEAVSIIDQARAEQVDLIVLGAHGKHFFRDVFLGTTAEKVVRESDCSVLVVRDLPQGPYGRILITVDFSETSRRMMSYALSLAPDADLYVLHAYQRQSLKDEKGTVLINPTKDYAEYKTQLENSAHAKLDQFLDEFDFGSRHVKRIVKYGYPPNVIRTVAKEHKPDLTLVGANSHSDLQHLMLGDTAEHALRELPCDVLVVRPPAIVANMRK